MIAIRKAEERGHFNYGWLDTSHTFSFADLLQIWIFPERRGIDPGYEQRDFPEAERRGRLRLIGSADGRDGSVTIHQDMDLYESLLAPGETVTHKPEADVGGSAVPIIRPPPAMSSPYSPCSSE